MLLVVGEPIVAYQRDLSAEGPQAPFHGPWPSGSPAICAYVAARLGTSTMFIGAVGQDDHGQVMRAGLERGGVDTSRLLERASLPTASARITYRGDHREFDFKVAESAAVTLTPADLHDLPERADWVHLSGTALVFGGALVDTALSAAHRAIKAGARLSVDPNVRPEALPLAVRDELLSLVQAAHVLLPSEGELETLGLRPEALAANGATVCITHGDRGARLLHADIDELIAPVRTLAVDTDGAGDSFAAGFIAASLRGAEPLEAANAGVQVAALAVAEHGPMTATFQEAANTW